MWHGYTSEGEAEAEKTSQRLAENRVFLPRPHCGVRPVGYFWSLSQFPSRHYFRRGPSFASAAMRTAGAEAGVRGTNERGSSARRP